MTNSNKSTHTIENISKQFKDNADETFKFLYKTYKIQFVNYIQKANSSIDRETAIDIFQDSMVIMYDNLVQNKLREIENVKAYLFRVGQLITYDRLRKQKKNSEVKGQIAKESSDMGSYLDQYEFLNPDNDRRKVKNLLDKLGERCRDLLIAFYYRNLTLEEIAIGNEYSNAKSVKSQKFKCIQRLRNYANESGK